MYIYHMEAVRYQVYLCLSSGCNGCGSCGYSRAVHSQL